MKAVKAISLLLALLMVLTVFAGCGTAEPTEKETDVPATESRNEEQTQPSDTEETESASQETETTEPATDTAQVTEPVAANLPTGLTATKVATVEGKRVYTTSSSGVIYYDDNDAMGVMSPDGKSDTGAKYSSCSTSGSYFVVTEADKDSIDPNTPASLNCFGLIDATGKELIPQKYASVEAVNDRFIYVVEVTEATDSKDDALVYYSSSFFSITPDKDDPLYMGVWYVYDVLMDRFVEGVTGTSHPSIFDTGDFIRYKNADGDRITVDAEGKELPEYAETLGNDCYKYENAVYNSKHEKVFDIDPNGHSPYTVDGEYYIASNYTIGTYVLMDYNGNVVSAEYPEYPSVYGSLVSCDDKIYNFKGEQVIEGSYDSVRMDEMFRAAWILEDNDVYTMIDKDGNVLWQGAEDDGIFVYSSDFCISKETDNGNLMYSFAQKDYVVDGYSLAPWLVTASHEGYTNDVVDTISGQTIIEGYWDYEHIASYGATYYVYAQNISDGGFDIYTINVA